jgi:hypothetical protein
VYPVETLLKIDCQVNHSDPGPADEYGDHPLATITTTNERCWMAQSARAEDELVETERWLVYLPPEVVIDANDSVVVGTETYYVFGVPWRVIDPVTGIRSHIEAVMERRV